MGINKSLNLNLSKKFFVSLFLHNYVNCKRQDWLFLNKAEQLAEEDSLDIYLPFLLLTFDIWNRFVRQQLTLWHTEASIITVWYVSMRVHDDAVCPEVLHLLHIETEWIKGFFQFFYFWYGEVDWSKNLENSLLVNCDWFLC